MLLLENQILFQEMYTKFCFIALYLNGKFLGMLILKKICLEHFWGRWHFYSDPMSHAPNVLTNFFLTRVHAASSRLVQDPLVALWLVRGPLNFHVAFNKTISEVQGCKAPPADLELIHYQQCVPK